MPFPAKLEVPQILEAALQLLRSYGLEAVTMRRLAADLNVQASSLYRHFPSREAIVLALSEHAAARLEARMGKAASGKEPAQALRAAATAYLRFSREEPALFSVLLQGPDNAAERPHARSVWQLVVRLVSAVSGRRDDTSGAVALWSFLHGFATLEASGSFGASGPKQGYEAGLSALVRGLAPDPVSR